MPLETYTQAELDAIVAEYQAQIAMLAARCANHALANSDLAARVRRAEAALAVAVEPAPPPD